jgi:uncharacterized membrane protein YtjA (UPF0391 family)
MLKLVWVFAVTAVIAAVLGFGTVVANATTLANMVLGLLLGVAAIFLAAAAFPVGSAIATCFEHRRRVPHGRRDRARH